MSTIKKSYLTNKCAEKFLAMAFVLLFAVCSLTSCAFSADNLLPNKKATVNFQELFGKYSGELWCEIGSDGSYMEIDTNPTNADDDNLAYQLWYATCMDDIESAIKEVNKALGFGEGLYIRMSTTTALQGRQNEENDLYRVSWTYHPDNGLQVLYEVKPSN